MRIFLLFILSVFFSKSYSQTLCFGKFYDEVKQTTNTQPTTFYGKRALTKNIDNNSILFFVFTNEVCNEYDILVKTMKSDSIEYFVKPYLTTQRMNVRCRKVDDSLYNIIIRNE